MTAAPQRLFGRKAGLLLSSETQALDLSELEFSFHTHAPDSETPFHAEIRVYNLSQEHVNLVTGEFNKVSVQGGYVGDGNYGEVFTGTVKQYHSGREGVDTYLDIFATDGDLLHNFGIINTTLAAGSTYGTQLNALNQAAAPYGAKVAPGSAAPPGGILPRGKVLCGMIRDYASEYAATTGQSWFIENGVIHTVPLTGYRAGEAVVLTTQTGLLGRPEQTNGGVLATCLMNPKLRTGCLVKIDNKSINKTIAAKGNPFNIPYNQLAAIEPVQGDNAVDTQFLAQIAADGLYKVLVVEHSGDTRGHAWQTDLTCIALNASNNSVSPYTVGAQYGSS
jgi:hypothetical protein